MGRAFRPQRAHIIFICLCTIAFYAASVNNYWIKDDLNLGQITNGTSTLDWGSFSRFAWPSHMTHDQFWRPVPVLMGYIDYAFWGSNPAGYHIVNMLLHALNGILLYLLANRLTGFKRPMLGFIAALLFVLNPIAPESIIWILQRMVLMCTMFSLWALLFYLKGVETRRTAPRVAAFVLLALAILSKEIGATLPACFFALDLFWSPGDPSFKTRLQGAFRWAVPSAVILAIYLLCRWMLFGRLTISYGEMEPLEYARHNQVFERLSRSLRNCTLPVNTSVFSERATMLLRAGMAIGYGIALIRGLSLLRTSRIFRHIAAFSTVFALVSFAPTILIFWVDDDLFNARFFYEPSIAIIMLAATALWLPKSDATPRLSDTPFGALSSAILILTFSISLGWGLGAFERAGNQVRGIQQALADEAELTDNTKTMVALWTPSRVQGVPTLEWSLVQAMRPPFLDAPVNAIPLLDIFANQATWPNYLNERMQSDNLGPHDLRYVRCEFNPPGITRVFSDPTPAIGPWPAILHEPSDGTPLRNDTSEPTFAFQPSGIGDHFRLRLDWDDMTAPIRINVIISQNAKRLEDGRVEYRLSNRDAIDQDLPDLWEAIVRKPHGSPLAITWRIESLDSAGELVGVSASHRLLIFSVSK